IFKKHKADIVLDERQGSRRKTHFQVVEEKRAASQRKTGYRVARSCLIQSKSAMRVSAAREKAFREWNNCCVWTVRLPRVGTRLPGLEDHRIAEWILHSDSQ